MGQAFLDAARNGDLPRIARGMENAVAASFKTHPMRGEIGTRGETKRRALICERWFRVMVEERDVLGRPVYGFGIDRALSLLREALTAELDGRAWEPTKTALWVPDRVVLT